jgi:hypothetical protein
VPIASGLILSKSGQKSSGFTIEAAGLTVCHKTLLGRKMESPVHFAFTSVASMKVEWDFAGFAGWKTASSKVVVPMKAISHSIMTRFRQIA